MRSAVVALLFLVGVATAAQIYNGQVQPDGPDTPEKPIVDLQRNDDTRGQFAFTYTSADGTQVEEEGHLVPTSDGYALAKSGKYSYYDPSGKHIVTSWVADESGFNATGDHLPKA